MKPARARGFVLHEAVMLAVAGAALLACLAVMGERSRSLSSLGESMANLRKLHQATAAFAEDNEGRFATFTWRAGQNPSQYPDLVDAGSDISAASNQAVDIIRRRAVFPAMPRVSGWLPHLYHSHLMLADYLDSELPMRFVISPEDPGRLAFSRDRSQWTAAGTNARLAFSSSYECPIAFWSWPHSGDGAIYPGTYNSLYVPSGAQFGGRPLQDVLDPSRKALYYDRHQRHFGPRQGYFMHEEARVPVVAVDGAVALRRGADGNQGWQPSQPQSPDPAYVLYNPPSSGPYAWDPPALDPSGQEIVPARYRCTRNALAGRDFDGPESQ